MKHFALIGKSLSHSYSKRYFDTLFAREGMAGHCYTLCELASVEGLREWVRREAICGFNVTIPFKEVVVSQLDALSDEAAAIGAVNCVRVETDGRLTGLNTDAPAFKDTLSNACARAGLKPRRALVLGRGGAAKAVSHALTTLGIEHLMTDRSLNLYRPESLTQPIAEKADEAAFDLLVNATPVGTTPDTDRSPWPYTSRLHSGMMVYDLVYNPTPTLLLRQASERGCHTIGGLDMLRRQAELSWQLWTEHR